MQHGYLMQLGKASDACDRVSTRVPTLQGRGPVFRARRFRLKQGGFPILAIYQFTRAFLRDDPALQSA